MIFYGIPLGEAIGNRLHIFACQSYLCLNRQLLVCLVVFILKIPSKYSGMFLQKNSL